MRTIARRLPVLVMLFLVPFASATTVAPDIVLIEVDLQWTVPYLPTPVRST